MAEVLFVRDGEFQSIVFDVTLEENPSYTADVTDHPVETGSEISDNVRDHPDALTLVVFVSNTPIISPNVNGANGSVGAQFVESGTSVVVRAASVNQAAERETQFKNVGVNVLSFPDPVTRVQAVHDELIRVKSEKTELTVITSLREYDTMILREIACPANGQTGGARTFTLTFRAINVADTQTVAEPDPLETRDEAERRRGAAGTTEPTPERRSFAAALVEDYGGIDLLH